MLTQERLNALMNYDRLTGRLTWKFRPNLKGKSKSWNSRYSGKEVGVVDKSNGYKVFRLDKKTIFAHRAIWMLERGWLPDEIDHKDGNRLNNALSNLRPATSRQQKQNTKLSVRNKTGFKGVSLHTQTGRPIAQITINGLNTHLGTFESIEDAALAYKKAAKKHFGEFARYD